MLRLKLNLKSQGTIASLVLAASLMVPGISILTGTPQCLAADSQRQQVIDFEDDMIRGVNKQPYDSLNQISDKDKNKDRTHLYRKRASYKYETERTLKELRLMQ